MSERFEYVGNDVTTGLDAVVLRSAIEELPVVKDARKGAGEAKACARASAVNAMPSRNNSRDEAARKKRKSAEAPMPVTAIHSHDEAKAVTRKSAKQELPVVSAPIVRGEAVAPICESASKRMPSPGKPIDCEANDLTRESAIAAMPAITLIDGESKDLMRESAIAATPVIDPTTADLMGLADTRKTWQQARARIHLHALSLCRSACEGDKAEAVKLYKATAAGTDTRLATLIGPFIEDIDRWDERLKPIEKRLAKLVDDLPIAEHVAATRGLGALSIATLIGHTGPLNQYSRVSKVWRRLGLAVSDDGGERAALIVPGIADLRPRRAAAFVIGAGLIKAGNERFRAIYDREKAKALGKGWVKARAHNHAMRVATKDTVKQLWRAWK